MIVAPTGNVLPVQVGPATEYARQKRGILFIILMVQVAFMCIRFVWYIDVIGACVLALQVAVGGYAWQQDMNITYLSIFGVICFVNGVMTTLSAIIPMLISFATLQWLSTISSCSLPLANFAGAYLAYLVYKDFDNTQKAASMMPPMPAGMMPTGMFGGLFGGETQPLQGKGATMFQGQGYTLGSADAMSQGQAYGQQGLGQAQAGLSTLFGQGQQGIGQAQQGVGQAQAGFAGLLGQGQQGLAQAQAQQGVGQAQAGFAGLLGQGQQGLAQAQAGALGAVGTIPKGRHDVTWDPFMTRPAA